MMECKQWSVKNDDETKKIVEGSLEQLPFLNNETKVKEKADLFKAMGDETRLRIIGMLMIDDLCMCEIVSGLGGASSTISHHLKLLERSKVITSRKEGKFTIFQLEKEKLLPYLE